MPAVPITIRYVIRDIETDEDFDEEVTATAEIDEIAETDGQDARRGRILTKLAKDRCPKSYEFDDCGDYDERNKILEAFARTA